jgi:hypothetical protein
MSFILYISNMLMIVQPFYLTILYLAIFLLYTYLSIVALILWKK